MTKEGWREVILNATRKNDTGDSSALELLAQLLYEQDEAKNSLREKGYGCTGMPWAETVDEVPSVGIIDGTTI